MPAEFCADYVLEISNGRRSRGAATDHIGINSSRDCWKISMMISNSLVEAQKLDGLRVR